MYFISSDQIPGVLYKLPCRITPGVICQTPFGQYTKL